MYFDLTDDQQQFVSVARDYAAAQQQVSLSTPAASETQTAAQADGGALDKLRQLWSQTQDIGQQVQALQAKASGIFDPMEETIGLFKVIFVPQAEEEKNDLVVGQYKWIAALFQFSIVFATLLLLDLIAILSKVMSRPGPYDVLVEFPEFAARCNLEAMKAQYRQQVAAELGVGVGGVEPDASARAGVDLRDTGAVADLLLKAYTKG